MRIDIVLPNGTVYKGVELNEEAMEEIETFLIENIESCTFVKFTLDSMSELFLPGDIARKSAILFIRN